MRTVHVITTAPSPRTRRARRLALAVLGSLLLALAVLGHVVVLAIGAMDALLAALIGIPRAAWWARPVVEEARQQWREIIGEETLI